MWRWGGKLCIMCTHTVFTNLLQSPADHTVRGFLGLYGLDHDGPLPRLRRPYCQGPVLGRSILAVSPVQQKQVHYIRTPRKCCSSQRPMQTASRED